MSLSKIPRRKVRSFVKRTGRMSDSQKSALDNLWPKWGLEPQDVPYQWQQVFGRQADITLDVGFGMGHSLLTLAEQHPEQDFIGMEVHQSGIASVLKGIEEKQLTNIRLFQRDAVDMLSTCIPDHSINKILLLFPDPWHKKRHHKRRLVQASFLELIAKKFKSGGIFHVATDWQDYAQHVLEVLAESPLFDAIIPPQGYNQRPEDRPLTKYEQRGIRLGHKIWDLSFRLRPSPNLEEVS